MGIFKDFPSRVRITRRRCFIRAIGYLYFQGPDSLLVVFSLPVTYGSVISLSTTRLVIAVMLASYWSGAGGFFSSG